MKTFVVTSLKDALRAAFLEFAVSDNLESVDVGTFGRQDLVQVSQSRQSGQNGPFTMVLKEHICSDGRSCSVNLMVFDYPIKHHGVGPSEIYYPLLSIDLFTDDPPYEGFSDPKWEKGKGFWVNEFLVARYSDRRSRAEITSEYGDWEFGFLLRLQERVHELAKTVSSRGHWQCEWNPTGDFSEKRVLRR